MQTQPPKLLQLVSDAIRTIQELLGHKAPPCAYRRNVKTTMIYTHALRYQRGGLAVKSPLDP